MIGTWWGAYVIVAAWIVGPIALAGALIAYGYLDARDREHGR